MNDASDTRTDYVHRIETDPERPWDRDDDHADMQPLTGMEELKFWATVMAAVAFAIGLAAAVAVLWPVKG